MRIVIAPDSFKGSLSALEAAEAMSRGVERACGADVDLCPLSDGGEGLASVLSPVIGATERRARVLGPTAEPLEASWLSFDGGRAALIESASAIGLDRVPNRRDASWTTTYGVGELIAEALSAGARTILVGLGGSATTDGGAGMAQALGISFDGAPSPVMGAHLGQVRAIDVNGRDPRLATAELVALVDVDNPLTGETGAACVYGPQKGATRDAIHALDAGLRHLAALRSDPGTEPGDGAAGGLGYGLRVFAGARLANGIDFVLDTLRFRERIQACDLVLTGEGRLDGQSARGKVVAGVCRRCRIEGVPVVALAGAIGPGADALYRDGLSAYFSLCDGPMTESEAMKNAAELLSALARNVVLLRETGRPRTRSD